jgi:hypothetical protein
MQWLRLKTIHNKLYGTWIFIAAYCGYIKQCVTGVRKYGLLYDTALYILILKETLKLMEWIHMEMERKLTCMLQLMYVCMCAPVAVKVKREPELILFYLMCVL